MREATNYRIASGNYLAPAIYRDYFSYIYDDGCLEPEGNAPKRISVITLRKVYKKNCCFEKVFFFIYFNIRFYTLSAIWVLCTYSLLSHLVEFTRNFLPAWERRNKLWHTSASEEKQQENVIEKKSLDSRKIARLIHNEEVYWKQSLGDGYVEIHRKLLKFEPFCRRMSQGLWENESKTLIHKLSWQRNLTYFETMLRDSKL